MNDSSIIATNLSPRAVRALARHGIVTVAQIKENYPKGLLRIEGFGMVSLRAVETAFFPGLRYGPKQLEKEQGHGTPSVDKKISNNLIEEQHSAHASQ